MAPAGKGGAAMRKTVKAACFLLAAALLITACVLGYPRVMKALYPVKYSEFVMKYSREYDIDPLLVYAIIKTESNFDPEAVSNAGALGLMQITPETFDWAKNKMGAAARPAGDILDPETNIQYGVYIFSCHFKEFQNLRLAAAAYHAGRGNVNRWLKDTHYSPDGENLTVIPISETENYVYKIVENYARYSKLYGGDPAFAYTD